MVALKPSSKLPFGRVAVAGLIMLAVSLTLRTSFMVLGGPHLNSGAPQQESAVQSAEQSAVKRFCTPPLAPQGAAAAQGRGSSSGGMARAGSDDSEGSSGSDLNSRSMDGQGAKQDAEGPVTWQEIDRLISQPAQVHGRQKKAGLPANWRSALGHMVNMSPWLPAGLPPSITPEITKWLEMTGRWVWRQPYRGLVVHCSCDIVWQAGCDRNAAWRWTVSGAHRSRTRAVGAAWLERAQPHDAGHSTHASLRVCRATCVRACLPAGGRRAS